MRRRAWTVIGLIALAAGLAWSILSWERAGQGDRARSLEAEVAEARPQASSVADGEPRSISEEAPSSSGIRISTLLLPDAGVSAVEDSVRVGLAHVSEEARARHLLWLQSGAEGAGPKEMGELAEVQRWIEVPAKRLPDGRVQVGPAEVPRAQFYLLEARGSDGLRFYRSRFSAQEIPSEIVPVLAAGLRLRAATDDPRLRLQLLRRAEVPQADVWRSLLASDSPQLQALFEEGGHAVRTGSELLPLAPSSFEAVAWLGQVEIQRSTLELSPGRITELTLDTASIEDAQRRVLDLEIELIDASSGTPVADVAVTLPGPQGEVTLRTDEAGRVRWPGLPAGHQAWVSLEFPEVQVEGLPRWPVRKLLPIALPTADDAPEGGVHREVVEVSPLSWLVLAGEGRRTGPPIRGQLYPVYGLQRERDGAWEELGSDHFVPIRDGLAVAIVEPGTYRAFKAESPWNIAFSQAAGFGGLGRPLRLRVPMQSPVRGDVSVRLVDEYQRPWVSTPVVVASRLPGLPTASLATDVTGLLHFEEATDITVEISVVGAIEAKIELIGRGGTSEEIVLMRQ